MKKIKFIKNKRTQLFVLRNVIIILLCTVVLAVFIKPLVAKTKTSGADSACTLSIQMAAAQKKLTGGLWAMDIKCPPHELLIEEGDVLTKRKAMKRKRIDDKRLKDIIAKEMYLCWKKIGRGSFNPLVSRDTFEKIFGKKKGSVCLICSNVDFDPKLIRRAYEKEDYDLKALSYHFARYKIPIIDKTLYEYLFGEKPTLEILNQLKEEGEDQYSPLALGSYSIFWRMEYAKERGIFDYAAYAVGAAAAGAAIVVSGGTATAIFAVIASTTLGAGTGYTLGTLLTNPKVGPELQKKGFVLVGGVNNYKSTDKVRHEIWYAPRFALTKKLPNAKGEMSYFCEHIIKT